MQREMPPRQNLPHRITLRSKRINTETEAGTFLSTIKFTISIIVNVTNIFIPESVPNTYIFISTMPMLKMPDFLGEVGNVLFILMSTPEKQVFKRDLWRLKCQTELFFSLLGMRLPFELILKIFTIHFGFALF